MRKLTLLLAIFLTTTITVAADAAGEGLVISEIQIDSVVGDGGIEDDWAELYNSNATAIDLSAYSLQKMNASGGSFYRKNLSGSIPAYGFFLVVRNHANTSQDLKDAADVLAAGTSFSLSEDNIIYLVSNNEDIEDSNDADIVDFVGFGLAQNFEGDTASLNPAEGGSIERKSGEVHDDSRGNSWDTNQNFDNFFNQSVPNPQNSSSEIENPIVEESDTTPPVTTPSIGGGFYNSAQTVELAANELATIFYTLDESEPTSDSLIYEEGLIFETTTTLKFFAVDSAGNEEAIQTEDYTIDSDSPVFEEGAILAAEAGDELVILTWSAASDENFEGYFLRTNGEEEESLGDEVLTFTKTNLTNGDEYDFILIARDLAGNETTLAATVTPNGPTIETVADYGEVIFNEIAWAGSTASPSDEWIELKNTTSNKIFDLTNWKIIGAATSGGDFTIESGSVAPGELFLISNYPASYESSVLIESDFDSSSLSLSNDGFEIILLDSAETEINRVDGSAAWSLGGDSASRKTLARFDSENFRTSFEIDGTPRAANFRDHDIAVVSISVEPQNPLPNETVIFTANIENRGLNSETNFKLKWSVDGEIVDEIIIENLASFDSTEKTFTQTFAAGDFAVSATLDFSDETSDNNSSLKNLTVENHLVINEFLPNPEGADPGSEWIELFNPTDEMISLGDYKINGTPLSGSIEQDGFFVLDNFDGLVNSADEVVLTNSADEIIDSKTYVDAVEKKSFGRSSDDLTVWIEFFHPTKNVANIEENELPTAVVTIQGSGNSTGGCSLFVNLTAEDSTDADGDDLEFEWDFDNGSTSDDSNPAGFYFSAGDYAVTLTVTDSLGGFTEVTQNFTVSGCGSGGEDSAKESLKKEITDEPVFDSISAERVILQINEVSVDSEADWIELRMLDDGNSGHGIDIGGFYFEDDKRIKTIPQNTKLKSGDFLTLTFKSEEEDWNSLRDGVWQIFTAKSGMTKTDEQIILLDSSGQIEDAVVWENRDGKWSRGEDDDVDELVVAGEWLSKNFEDAVDSSRIKREVVLARKNSADSNSQADWFLTPFSTPGAINSSPPVRAGDFQFLITEVQPKNPQGDFVKIECLDCSSAVSLSGFSLKFGTRDEIFSFPTEAEISKEKPVEITFHSSVDQFSNNIFTSTFIGLVASDGLLTLKDFENTTADFVGWSNRKNPPNRDSDLADSEIAQLADRFRDGEWDGDTEVSLLDATEFQRGVRLLRQDFVDTNSAQDWKIQNPEIPLDEIAITTGDIRISEILPNPVGSDADNEWFELVNLGDSAVDLLGWSVSLNKAFYEFEESTLLQPGEFKAFHDLFSLRNTGGTLSISDPEGDLIDSLEYPALREGEAFARNVRGEFFATELPTPDVANGFYKTLSSAEDGDADGLSDEEEIQFQTNPEAFDSDGDSLSDAFEIHNGFDPNIPDATEEALQKFRRELQALAALNLICQADGEEGIFLAGSGIPGGKVRIYIHSELQIVEVSVNSEGGWNYVLDKSLEAGSHNIFTQLISPNGFEGVASKVMSFELQKSFQPPIFAEDLRFSEVLPNPVGEDSVAEWLEIENFGSEIADLSNFKISVGRKNFIFPEDSKISASGFLLISREESGITLPNSGGEISLATPTNRMIAELIYPKVAEGVGFAWDGSTFRTTQTPTPAAANSILMLTKKSSAKKGSIHKNSNGNLSTEIRISEILPNPVGADSSEFIELENFGSVAVKLGNWRIFDPQKTFTIPDSTILQPGEFRSFPKSLTKISLNNSGDEVSLSDFRGELISSVSFHSLPEGVSFALENSTFRETTIPTANAPNQFDSQKISGLIRFVGAEGFVIANSDGEFFVNFGEANSALLARALLRTGERWEIFATNFTGGFTLKNFTVAPDLLKSDLITLPSLSPVSSDRAWIFAFVVFLTILILLRFARTDAVWEPD